MHGISLIMAVVRRFAAANVVLEARSAGPSRRRQDIFALEIMKDSTDPGMSDMTARARRCFAAQCGAPSCAEYSAAVSFVGRCANGPEL